MSSVSLEQVSKRFPDGTTAVDNVSLEVIDRELLVLVGPSGCGKSTTLRLIAGLETPSSGRIRIGQRVVDDVAPKDRDIAMVFQNYALYPHMSVYSNLSFGLKLRFGGGFLARGLRRVFLPGRAAKLNRLRSGIDQQVRQTALRLGIEHLLGRKPHQLSGGERQRVALGRAIVRNPAAFLFDEPLSNLDAKLRGQMRIELRRLHREIGATMIYVTHDQVEAMTLGDRVAVMSGGRILQVGTPLAVYQRPANLFVAQFIGSVSINLQRGRLIIRNGKLGFEADGMKFDFEPAASQLSMESVGQLPREVVLGFRAEDVRVAAEGEDAQMEGQIVSVDRLGDVTNLYVDCQVRRLKSETNKSGANEFGGTYVVRAAADTQLMVGQRVRLGITTPRALWFDAESGENLLKE